VFEVSFTTARYAPPRTVTIFTPNNDWADITGTYVDGSWVFQLDETQVWNKPSYFKFFLDDRFWMDDPYIRISPVRGGSYNFDESGVTFMSEMTPATPAASALSSPSQPDPVAPTPTQPVPAVGPATAMPVSEGAIINRVVLLIAPVLTAVAAWLAALIARHVPGVTLDQTQIVSFMIAIVAVCLAGAWKWLQGWQQHELLVAQGLAAPIKPVIAMTRPQPPTTQ
jgi:hypothetical protein